MSFGIPGHSTTETGVHGSLRSVSSEEVSSSGVRITRCALGAYLVNQTARATLFNRGDTMKITSNTDPESTTTAVVTVRIPCGADSDLVTDAEERLSRAENIDAVAIDELHGIDPQLSATIVTVGVTLRWTAATTDAQVRRWLAAVPGFESIERIR